MNIDSGLSNIDRAINNHFESCYLLDRYKFPTKELNKENVNSFVDDRSPVQIYQDILLYLNEQLTPDLVKIWSEFLGRDVTDPCFYRSGLSYVAEDMRKVKKEFEYKKDIKISPEAHMPENMKRSSHSKHCKTVNDHCSYYASEISDLLINNNLTKQNFISLMRNKQNVKILIDYLLSKNLPKHSRKKLNFLKNMNESKNGLLNATFKKYIFNLTWQYGEVKIRSPQDCKEIFVSNFLNKKLQAFVKGFLSKESKKSLENQAISKFLLDSGSTSNILNYNTFRNMDFKDSEVIKCGKISLQGSAGLRENTFLGYIDKNIYIQAEDGKFYNSKQVFYVLRENLEIPNILGQPFLSSCEVNLKYSKVDLRVPAIMKNKDKKDESIYLRIAKQKSISTLNHLEIQPGDTSATFYLKDVNISELGECKVKCDKLEFLPVDFGSLKNHLVTNQGIFSELSDETFALPLKTPAKTLIAEKDCKVQIENCFFVSNEVEKLFFCEPGESSDKLQGSPGPGKDGSNCQEKIPELKEFLLQMSEERSKNQDKWDRAQQNFFSTMDTESGPDLGNISLSEEIKDLYVSEIFEDKSEEEDNDVIAFLTSTHGINEEELVISEEPEFVSPSERVLVDHDCGIESGQKIPGELVNHLSKEDRQEMVKMIKKYPDVWAKSKYSIGNFTGFKCQIPTKPGKTAVQKERRQAISLIEKVDQTMEGLFKAGVFGLSTGDHERFLANANIVPKLENTDQIQLNSKADRHIARVAPLEDKRTNLASGWRAAIDYKDLNFITEDIGRIQLPTLKEVEEACKGSLISSVDLKNQYYAIEIEEAHRSKTNFFWKNNIWMAKRLAMGLSNAPYVAFQAMKFSFRKEVLQQFLDKNNIKDFPFESFDSFVKIYLDDILCHTPRKQISPKFTPKKLHFICLEAILFALQENGWIASLNKSNFLKDEITFLGQIINCKDDSSRMSSARVRAIMDWRNPKSFGELNSRLAVLSYFSKYVIGYRLIALPLILCLKQPTFEWTPACQIAFNNLKFLISLNISLAHFDPDKILLATSDSSQVSYNAAFFMFDPKSLDLRLIDTQTRLFSKSQINYAPVQRESTSLMFTVSHGEAYIRNCNTETWLLCDASSLQYIARNKAYSSRQYNDALFLSTLPRLNIFYCSGKALLLSDILSRQFQTVVLSKNFELSSEMAKLIPPLSKLEIKNLTKLDPELLTNFVLSNPRQEVLDTYPKRFHYHQNVRKTHFHNMQRNICSELEFLCGLSLGWNNKALLQMDVWKDILKSKGQISKTLSEHVLKSHNLQKLHQKIMDLNLSNKTIETLLNKYNSANKSSVNKESCFYLKSSAPAKCQCKECVIMQENVQLDPGSLQSVTEYLGPITDFLESAAGVLGQVYSSMHKNFLKKLDSCRCSDARILMTLLFFQELLHKLSAAKLHFDKKIETTSVTFIPFYINDLFTLKITDANTITLTTKQSFEITEMASFTLDLGLILGFKGKISEINFFDKYLFLLSAPSLEGMLFHLEKMTVFNCSEKPLCISANQDVCTFVLNTESDHLVLTKVESRELLSIGMYQSDKAAYNSMNNLYSVLSSNVCYWLEAQATNLSKPKSKKQILSEEFEVRNRALEHGIFVTEISKSGNGVKDSLKQREVISSILLGQTLLKNQNIFSDELLADLQVKDFELRKEIQRCNKGTSKDFFLKNDVLYKRACIAPNTEVIKLCLPSLIAREILWRLHVNRHLHIANSQIMHIYSQNFYTPNLNSIAKQVRSGCAVCTICKNNYKMRYSGQERENKNLAVGQEYVFDVAYLPRDKMNYKYVLLMTEKVSSYVIGQPMKNLNSENTAKALQQFLLHIPAPEKISCDGGPEFSGAFEKLCQEMDILLITKLVRRSQPQGQAECCIRDCKALLTRIAASFPEGRSRWSNFLPLCLQNLNLRHPYAQKFSRRNLYFSPYFYNLLSLAITTENGNEGFDPKMLELQKKTHNFLENKRKDTLLKLFQKTNKPFEMKVGQILTNNSTTSELSTVDDSKQLQPNSLKLYKILEIRPGNMGALCRNLHTGRVKTHQIANLRKLNLDEMLRLTAIDPAYSFKNQLASSRIRNLHGKFTGDLESPDYNLDTTEVERKTRSGKTYATILTHATGVSSILRKKLHEKPDLSSLGVAQKRAIIRGMALARSLGFEVQKDALKEDVPGRSLNIYNGEDKKQIRTKAGHTRHVRFAEKMRVRKDNIDTEEETVWDKKEVYKCHLSFLFEPMFDLSIKEIKLLK